MNYRLLLPFLLFLFIVISCGEDEVPEYKVTTVTLNDDGYFGSGELTVLFSIDDGDNYFATPPSGLISGATFNAKISNGTEDLSSTNVLITWAVSGLEVDDANGATPTFTVQNENATIEVTVADAANLYVVRRNGGQMFQVDRATGVLTSIGTITRNGNPVNGIRSMVANPNDGLLYAASTNSNGGVLYSINPSNLQATIINNNPDGNWWGVSELYVTADNLLLARLWYRNPVSNTGVGYFLTNGSFTTFNTQIIFDIGTNGGGFMYMGNSESEIYTNDFLDVYRADFTDRNLSGNTEVTLDPVVTLVPQGFPATGNDLTSVQNVLSFAPGLDYCLMYEYDNQETYFASIDLEAGTVDYISLLGNSNSLRYHALSRIPDSFFD